MWDDDEVFVPINDINGAGSPRVREIDERNSLIFSTDDLKK